MKQIINFAILLLLSCASAKAQYGIPYQAIARSAGGAILANQAVGLRFSIRDSAATGAVLYTETFAVTTDAEGLFNVNMGTGTVATGNFNTINWGAGAKFMQMEVDPAGGTSYTNMGTQQLMAVPYALFAKNGLPPGTTGDVLYHDGANWQKLPAGAPGHLLSVQNGTPAWVSINEAFKPVTLTNGATAVGYQAACLRLNMVNKGFGTTTPTVGFIWSTTKAGLSFSTTYPNKVFISGVNAVGTYTVNIAGLTQNTKYYFRAFGYYYSSENLAVSQGEIDSFTTSVPLVLGQNYGGGKVVSIFGLGYGGDYVRQHGLVAATADLPGTYVWGCPTGSPAGATLSHVQGASAANTATIAAGCGAGTAAKACYDLVLNGYDDWFLPNQGDMSLVNWSVSAGHLGITPGTQYWMSFQVAPATALSAVISPGGIGGVVVPKTTALKVRPMRQF